jgi:hypothetical protein
MQAAGSVIATTEIRDDIQPFTGTVGPSHPLYGLKLALENIDESFTPSPSGRIEKQLDHAGLRIAEVKMELRESRVAGAEAAIGQYYEKVNTTIGTVRALPENATGLLQAQETIAKHQYVLERLLATHEEAPGLGAAYANSRTLEAAFTEKTNRAVSVQELPNDRAVVQVIRVSVAGTPVQPVTVQVSPAAHGTPLPQANLTQVPIPVKNVPQNHTTDSEKPVTPVPPLVPKETPQPGPSEVPANTPSHAPTVIPSPPPQATPAPTPEVTRPVITQPATPPAPKPVPSTEPQNDTLNSGTNTGTLTVSG